MSRVIGNSADKRRRTDTSALVRGTTLILFCLIAEAGWAATFYVSATGDDLKTGTTAETAWQSIAKVNSTKFAGGDRIVFEGGQSFKGRIYFDAADTGSAANPITVSSYGSGRATIDGATGNTLYAYNTAGINISNLNFVGSGSSTNTGTGLVFYCDLPGDVKLNHLHIDNVDISGFQYGIRMAGKNGASGYDDVRLTNSVIHDNQREGMRTSGLSKYAITNVYVGHCEFHNNIGDPLMTTNSGSGLILGQVDGAIVERCLAHDNGALCTSEDGGSGIWCHDSTNVVIQSNESWNNRTSGPNDGGGFGLDGATTHSILQYNYSHDNDGAGIGLYQYFSADKWSNNIVRYNISQNDGRRNGFAGIQVANKSSGISDCEIYNNTIFMSPANGVEPRAVWFISGTENFHLRNNLFVTTGGVPIADVNGQQSGWEFQGNVYWSGNAPLRIVWNGLIFSDLESWRAYTGQENMSPTRLGIVADPNVANAGGGAVISNPDALEKMNAYILQDASPIINSGMKLTELFGIDPGPRDFFGNPLPQDGKLDVGACEFPGIVSGSAPNISEAQHLKITSLRGNAAVGSTKSMVSFSAILGSLPTEINLVGQTFIADVAGASGTFAFDARGRSSSPQGTARLKLSRVKLRLKTTQLRAPTITVKLTGDWATVWSQRGLIPEIDVRDKVDVPISFLFDNRVYATVLTAKRTTRKESTKISK
jgi:hypothetical protein